MTFRKRLLASLVGIGLLTGPALAQTTISPSPVAIDGGAMGTGAKLSPGAVKGTDGAAHAVAGDNLGHQEVNLHSAAEANIFQETGGNAAAMKSDLDTISSIVAGLPVNVSPAGVASFVQNLELFDQTGSAVIYPNPAPVVQPGDLTAVFTGSAPGLMTTTSNVPVVSGWVDTYGYHSVACVITSFNGGSGYITYLNNWSTSGTGISMVGPRSDSFGGSAIYAGDTQTFLSRSLPLLHRFFLPNINSITGGPASVVCTFKREFPGFWSLSYGQGPVGEGYSSSGLFNPTPTGFEGRTSRKAAVSNGTPVRGVSTTDGRQVDSPYALSGDTWLYPSVTGGNLSNTSAAQTVIAAAGSNVLNLVTSMQLSWTGIGASGCELEILNGSLPLWLGLLPSGGGVQSVHFPVPLKSSVNTAINVQTPTACGSGTKVYANLQGYVAQP